MGQGKVCYFAPDTLVWENTDTRAIRIFSLGVSWRFGEVLPINAMDRLERRFAFFGRQSGL